MDALHDHTRGREEQFEVQPMVTRDLTLRSRSYEMGCIAAWWSTFWQGLGSVEVECFEWDQIDGGLRYQLAVVQIPFSAVDLSHSGL